MPTLYSQITCLSKILADRELEIPLLVAAGKIDPVEAQKELMNLKAILNLLKETEDKNQLKLKLS
jgi:hypothetical protein